MTPSTLAARLHDLSETMKNIALDMAFLEGADTNTRKHARELQGASKMARSWAAALDVNFDTKVVKPKEHV